MDEQEQRRQRATFGGRPGIVGSGQGSETAGDNAEAGMRGRPLRKVAALVLFMLMPLAGAACGIDVASSSGREAPAGTKPAGALRTTPVEPPAYAGKVSPAQSQNALAQLPASSADREDGSQPPALNDTEQSMLEDYADYITTVAEDVDAFWAQQFEGFESSCQAQGGGATASQYQAGGATVSQYQYEQVQEENTQPACLVPFTYESPGLRLYEKSTDSACGSLREAGAVYCPRDQIVYVQVEEVAQGAQEYGDFAMAAKVAHEFGHHVQYRLGYFDLEGNAVPVENQADCLSGVWANSAGYRGLIGEKDVLDAMRYRYDIGEPLSRNQTHGTPEERATWWYEGFYGGDASRCTGQQFDIGS